ncbi:yeats-domain-containing protein [Ramicandelaber brevisporus]|nr:yeats-domain-containing protein [Ramicandelaber brevisporus]
MATKTGQGRVKGAVIALPIVYGTIATELAEPKTSHTHKWIVCVQSPTAGGDNDLSRFISRVTFKLHETYDRNNRHVDRPGPYRVEETGWGEFSIQIKISFTSIVEERPITLTHPLRLYPTIEDIEKEIMSSNRSMDHAAVRKSLSGLTPQQYMAKWPKGKPVVNLVYEELLFAEPKEEFYTLMTRSTNGVIERPVIRAEPTELMPFSQKNEQDEHDRLIKAKGDIDSQVATLRNKVASNNAKMEAMRRELANLEKATGTTATATPAAVTTATAAATAAPS